MLQRSCRLNDFDRGKLNYASFFHLLELQLSGRDFSILATSEQIYLDYVNAEDVPAIEYFNKSLNVVWTKGKTGLWGHRKDLLKLLHTIN